MLSNGERGRGVCFCVFIVCRSFISHCIPILSPGTRSTDAPVVVTVYPEQSFWQASELFPMHHTRYHPNLEVSFFAALARSADGMTVALGHPTHPESDQSHLLTHGSRTHLRPRHRQRHGKVQFSGVSASHGAIPRTEM